MHRSIINSSEKDTQEEKLHVLRAAEKLVAERVQPIREFYEKEIGRLREKHQQEIKHLRDENSHKTSQIKQV